MHEKGLSNSSIIKEREFTIERQKTELETLTSKLEDVNATLTQVRSEAQMKESELKQRLDLEDEKHIR